ncbi:MAG: response regulator, partial [Bacteroides intestinalis]|nr:response regulator [Bacteroides intestinalis]
YKLFMSVLKNDYKLIHAWDGREAVEMFKTYEPQMILMDINMPVMDGYEATKEIRKYSARVPIIAITAFAYASDEQRVMESGFDGYMPKPINARLLKTQIGSIMKKRILLL